MRPAFCCSTGAVGKTRNPWAPRTHEPKSQFAVLLGNLLRMEQLGEGPDIWGTLHRGDEV